MRKKNVEDFELNIFIASWEKKTKESRIKQRKQTKRKQFKNEKKRWVSIFLLSSGSNSVFGDKWSDVKWSDRGGEFRVVWFCFYATMNQTSELTLPSFSVTTAAVSAGAPSMILHPSRYWLEEWDASNSKSQASWNDGKEEEKKEEKRKKRRRSREKERMRKRKKKRKKNKNKKVYASWRSGNAPQGTWISPDSLVLDEVRLQKTKWTFFRQRRTTWIHSNQFKMRKEIGRSKEEETGEWVLVSEEEWMVMLVCFRDEISARLGKGGSGGKEKTRGKKVPASRRRCVRWPWLVSRHAKEKILRKTLSSRLDHDIAVLARLVRWMRS